MVEKFLGTKVAQAPVDGARGGEQYARFEAVFGTDEMQYLELRDIQRKLIPAMRRQRVDRVVLAVYNGESEELLAELAVVDDGRSTTVTTEGGEDLTFFSSKPMGGRRPSFRQTTKKPIAKWLQETMHLRTDDVTFCPFDPSVEVDEIDDDESDQEPEGVEQGPEKKVKKPKRTRRPIRRKKTDKERKERASNKAAEQIEEILNTLNTLYTSLDVRKIRARGLDTSPLQQLGVFLAQNPGMFNTVVEQLRSGNYDPLYKVISLLRDPLIVKGIEDAISEAKPKAGYGSRVVLPRVVKTMLSQLKRLAAELHPNVSVDDPDRNVRGQFYDYETSRSLEAYQKLLFVDLAPEDMLAYIKAAKNERWLDVGAGETYRQPDSFMNTVRSENPTIEMRAADPMYAGEVGPVDKAYGRDELDEEWATRNHLDPYTAQRLAYEDASFDRVFSCWALDKTRLDNGGELQALLQIARILKPGGEARLFPVRPETVKQYGHVLMVYFTIENRVDSINQDTGELFGYGLYLRRNNVSKSSERQLTDEVNRWLRENPK